MTEKVRTTMRPYEEFDAEPEEVADLKALGLLYTGNAQTPDGALKAVEKKQAADSAATTENKE